MKNATRLAIVLLILLVLCLPGCQLAKNVGAVIAHKDRLAGVFVTTDETLDLGKQGRLYATLKKTEQSDPDTGESYETTQYVFDGVKGYAFFTAVYAPGIVMRESCTATEEDDAISDSKSKISGNNEGFSVDLEGTIYYVLNKQGHTCYPYPVYETADGRVYITECVGLATGAHNDESQTVDVTDGEKCGITLNENCTMIVSGKAAAYETSVKLNISEMIPPTKIVVLQMDANNAMVSRKEYVPGLMPKAITPEAQAVYIIVQSYKSGSDGKEHVTRTFYDNNASTIETFSGREDGICIEQRTKINWAK